MKAANIVHLHDRHDSFRSPEVVLKQATEHAKRIKRVVVLIEWDDGSFALDHSPATVQELMVLQRVGRHQMTQLIDQGMGELVIHPVRQV